MPNKPPPRIAVLDTQSVLDWLFFENPVCAEWEAWRLAGHWQWVATPAMRAELAYVLQDGRFDALRHPPERALAVLAHWDACVRPAPAPGPAPHGWPRCSDPDDQIFLDLALALPATWLISRDKAVLKQAKRCWALKQVQVLPPKLWRP